VSSAELPGYERFDFASGGQTRPVFHGGTGPGVLLMHEMPGLTPACVDLAGRIRAQGFSVFMPVLFGDVPQRDLAPVAFTARLASICVRREFDCFSKHASSPVTDWLRALGRDVHARCVGPGIGVIGMCYTGGYVFAMMADDYVLAPVASQPSQPFGKTPAQKRALAVSPGDLERAKQRASAGTPLMALRFTNDSTCPRERFQTLRTEFGDALREIQIPSPDSAHGISADAHSVLTGHFQDTPGHPTREAMDQVLSFLAERLRN
jgi:dienelactone hydrolase